MLCARSVLTLPCLPAQVRAHQLVLPPCDVVIKAVADYVRNIQDTTDLDAIAKDVFQHSQVKYKAKYRLVFFFKSILLYICVEGLHLIK